MRIVLDTNVLARALASPGGPAGEVFEQAMVGHTLVVSLELLSELTRVLAYAPWSAFVIYLQQAADMRLLELIDGAVANAAVRLVVVADEIQPEQLRPLRDSIGRGNGRIRLITVGHCPTPEPSRIPALSTQPLDREMASKVVMGWYPAMPKEHVDFVVRFADGYVRLARLVADAVARDTAIDVRGLLSKDEICAFLNGMLGTGDRRALHVVAVLSSVGWSGDVQVKERRSPATSISAGTKFGRKWMTSTGGWESFPVAAAIATYHRRRWAST